MQSCRVKTEMVYLLHQTSSFSRYALRFLYLIFTQCRLEATAIVYHQSCYLLSNIVEIKALLLSRTRKRRRYP